SGRWFETDLKIRRSEISAAIGKGKLGGDAHTIDRSLDRPECEAESDRDLERDAVGCDTSSEVQRLERDRSKIQVERQIDFELRAALDVQTGVRAPGRRHVEGCLNGRAADDRRQEAVGVGHVDEDAPLLDLQLDYGNRGRRVRARIPRGG